MEKWKWSTVEGKFVKETWDSTKLSFERDRDYGFYSWPQRNYRCSFCRKEFKSAQALGGHMNVHRRDRARLRLSSPDSLLDSPNPNPNPSIPAAKVSSTAACHSSSFSSVSNPAFPSSPNQELHLGPLPRKQRTGYFSSENVPDIGHSQARILEICGGDRGKKNKGAMFEVGIKNDARMLKANDDQLVRLGLGMGFAGDHASKDQDLDLELRLGYC